MFLLQKLQCIHSGISTALLRAVQWNLYIMDIMGPFISVSPDYQGVLIIQVSLQIHAKAPFVAITKCVDYAGVLSQLS